MEQVPASFTSARPLQAAWLLTLACGCCHLTCIMSNHKRRALTCWLQATSFMVERLVRQLLAAGVGDGSFLLRKHVLAMLYAVPALEPYLAQPDW